MNSVNPDLKFTTECQEDYAGERLPTLDFSMWLNKDNKIQHTYFQKPTKTPYVIMERSGVSYHQKFQILSNELVRRLSNVDITSIPQEEINVILEQYTTELKTSGYSHCQARDLVSSGIRGWKAKHKKRQQDNTPFYRLAEDTIMERLKKDLTERENWYKDQNKEDEDVDQQSTSACPSKRRTTSAP